MSVVTERLPRSMGAIFAILFLGAAGLLAGCSSGPSQEQAVDLSSGQEAAGTRAALPSREPLVIVTPDAWPTPVTTASPETIALFEGTPSAMAYGTPGSTRQPTASTAPGPTLGPTTTPTAAPSRRLPEVTRSLDDRAAALSEALAAKDVDRAVQLQQDLLSEVTRGETALQLDKSSQADLVRQAILDLKAGAAGDAAKLDSARAKLAAAMGQSGSTAGASPTTLGPRAIASSLQSKLNSLEAARKEQRVNDVLRLQQELAQEISQAQKALAGQHDENADRLRSVLKDLEDGLGGEEPKLQSAVSALQTLSSSSAAGSPRQAAASVQIQSEAANLDNKLANLREALSGGDRDLLLRAQRDLLEAISRAEASVQGNNSEQAGRLRDALSLARAGATGDIAKLEGARSKLSDPAGSPSGAQSQSAEASPRARPADLPNMADELSRKVDEYKAAITKGDTQAMLRLQPEMLDQVNRYEQAVRGISGREGDQLRSALSDLRNALGGDLNKLNSANASLRLVAGGGESQHSSPGPAAPVQQSSQGAQVAARGLLQTADDAEAALESGDADDVSRVRAELERAKDSVQKLPPADASSLNAAIGALNEALAGDRSKLDAARSQLRQVIPR